MNDRMGSWDALPDSWFPDSKSGLFSLSQSLTRKHGLSAVWGWACAKLCWRTVRSQTCG